MGKNNTTPEKEKVPGFLNIPRLFQAEALSLLEAVERGKLLHNTKNIRDSGGPLEARFRTLLADRMPEGIQVKTGYLYDIESNCTPQIDAMLLSGSDNHAMMTTEDGAVYAPFTSALAVIEIKSSVGDAEKQLRQISNIVKAIEKMEKNLLARRPGYDRRKIMSVLFYASSENAKFEDFKRWNSENQSDMPTYVVFLDRGYIFAGRHLINELLTWSEEQPLGFHDHDYATSYYLCAPKAESEHKSGNTLLWLYYTLLNVVDRFKGRLTMPDPLDDYRINGKNFVPSFATAFVADAVSRYALYPIEGLAALDDWPEETAKKADMVAKGTGAKCKEGR